MKVVRELALPAAGAAVAGLVTWFLLEQNVGLGRWLLAALLFAHGWVHLVFLFPKPAPAPAKAGGLEYPFDMNRSWLIRAGSDAGLVRASGVALMAIVFAGLLLGALATVGVVVPAAWWAGLVAGSAVASALLLVLFYSPVLLLGFAIDLVLLWVVIASVWSPTVAAV